jgi:uncharacterized protein YbjQ (UPF0145 family)
MYVTTALDFAGYRITDYQGVVRGIVARAPTITQGIMGGLKQIIGGNTGTYTEMYEQAREEAFDLLGQHASARGANAVIGMRYDASDPGGHRHSATEVLCYGTAVVIEPAT